MQELSLARGCQGSLWHSAQHGGSCRGAVWKDGSRSARAPSSSGARWGTRSLGGTLCKPPQRKGESLAGRNISGGHGGFRSGDATGWLPLQQVPQGAVRAPGFSWSHMLLWSRWGHQGTSSCLRILECSLWSHQGGTSGLQLLGVIFSAEFEVDVSTLPCHQQPPVPPTSVAQQLVMLLVLVVETWGVGLLLAKAASCGLLTALSG